MHELTKRTEGNEPMTHSAKKIAKGIYEYRGFTIDQHETAYGNEWHVTGKNSLIEASETLKSAKAKIDFFLADGDKAFR